MDIRSKGLVDTFWLLGKEGGIAHQDNVRDVYDVDVGPEYLKELPSIKA